VDKRREDITSDLELFGELVQELFAESGWELAQE
jgi:hypothetical protein